MGQMLNNNISSICLHNMLNIGPLTAEICWRVWGTPSKFQRVSRIGLVTAPTSLNGRQPNFARCLAVSCAGILYIHFWGPLPPNGILPGAKFTLRPNLAFSYIGSVTARHSSTVRQPNFVAFRRGRSLIAVARPSVVCSLSSVTLVHPTQAVVIFGIFYGIWYLGHPLTSTKNFTKIVVREPLCRPGELNTNTRGVAKCSDFGPIEGYISETV